MTAKAPGAKPTARERPILPGEEDAGTDLVLGEFQNVPSLSLSEARLVINTIVENRAQAKRHAETDTLMKMQDYLDTFARFKDANVAANVENLVGHPEHRKHGLHSFERSQLASLCCESTDEAKTLIPSLTDKISDEDLQVILDKITEQRHLE